MKRKEKKRFSGLMWIIILVFLGIVIAFPKWITVFYPEPHRDLVFSCAYEHQVDPYLVFSIIRAESKFESLAVSPVGAKGLMQIMPDTALWIASQRGMEDFDTSTLHQPEVNIQFGCWYLADLSNEFQQLPLVIAAYNAGRGTVNGWIQSGQWDGAMERLEDIPFIETREYVQNVMRNYEAYRAIYTRNQ